MYEIGEKTNVAAVNRTSNYPIYSETSVIRLGYVYFSHSESFQSISIVEILNTGNQDMRIR